MRDRKTAAHMETCPDLVFLNQREMTSPGSYSRHGMMLREKIFLPLDRAHLLLLWSLPGVLFQMRQVLLGCSGAALWAEVGCSKAAGTPAFQILSI